MSEEHDPSALGRISFHAKGKRPFDRNYPIYIELVSSEAKGKFSFEANRAATKLLLKERAARFGVEIRKFEIQTGKLMITASFDTRRSMQNFLRTFTAMLPRKITGARKGKPFGKFWDHLAYTKVLYGPEPKRK